MRAFSVIVTSEAQADIRRLDPAIRERILSKLEWMGRNVELLRHEALQGDEFGPPLAATKLRTTSTQAPTSPMISATAKH